MDTFTIITVIAIILFARLGIRLLYKWRQLKRNQKDKIGE